MSDSVTDNERRRHGRKRFDAARGGVVFTVQIDETPCDILSVHDVSISGIRLGLAQRLQTGQKLVLTAKEGNFVIAVNGEVRWSNESAEVNGFESGVEFDGSDLDNNILFFMSLRKYLDSFDDVPLKEL